MYAFKLIAFIATAATAALIYKTAPAECRVRAFTVFAWNPAVIIEGAGEGHNDALMVAAVVVSLWLLTRRSLVGSAAALTLAVLTKWVPALFVPALLAYVWRQRWLTTRVVIAGVVVITGIAVAAFWPVWVGLDTFRTIASLTGESRFVASTVGVWIHLVADDHPTAFALLRTLVSVLGVAAVAWSAWDSRTPQTVIRGCATVALAFVLLCSPLFWAWYMFLPIALFTLSGEFALVWVLTLTSRIVAPLDLIRMRGVLDWPAQVWLTTIVGLWVPLLWIAWTRARPVLQFREWAAWLPSSTSGPS